MAGLPFTGVVVGCGLVVLSLCTALAWSGAGRFGTTPAVTRPLVGLGLAAVAVDHDGLGAVLGAVLAILGVVAAAEGAPPPQIDRPRMRTTAVVLGLTVAVVLAITSGTGPLDAVPEPARGVGALVAAALGLLLTVAATDRARVNLRDRVQGRLRDMHPATAARLGVPDPGTDPSVAPDAVAPLPAVLGSDDAARR